MMVAGQETGVLSLPDGDDTILVKGYVSKVIDVSGNGLLERKGRSILTQPSITR